MPLSMPSSLSPSHSRRLGGLVGLLLLVACGGGDQGGNDPFGGAGGGTSCGAGEQFCGGARTMGGAAPTGGVAATGGMSGGTGGSDVGCAVDPINPNPTRQARNLLCYLYQIYGTAVLSGQQETSWDYWQQPDGAEHDVNWYYDNLGVYPAVLGGDYLYPEGTTDRAIAYWNAGGIPMIRYHMGAPPESDTYENSQGVADMNRVLTAGTAEHDSLIAKLDYCSDELARLQSADVAVLWAPYHEFQPNGWFWWSKGTADQFRRLWELTYDYMTNTRGLNNLVWLAPSSGSPNASWYPDRRYYDVAGPDTYESNQPFAQLYSQAKNIIGDTVPIPLHETGTVPQPSSMFPSSAPWVLWNVWASYYDDGEHNTLATQQSAYASPYTITRDEVPDLN